jgi:hypothetical protein
MGADDTLTAFHQTSKGGPKDMLAELRERDASGELAAISSSLCRYALEGIHG